MGSRRSLLLALLVIFALAFVIRLTPLIWSPYPYNIDGLAEAAMSGDIYETGGLAVPLDAGYSGSYIVHMPLLNGLVATMSLLVGVEPLLLAQPIVAAIGAISCVAAALVVHMVTNSRRAGILAGVFLALLGTYVFCTTSVWKEALGLTMIVVIAGLFLERRDNRVRIVLTILLLMMTFIHHHSAILAYMFFTLASVAEAYLAMKGRKWSWRNNADIATFIPLWVLVELYYPGINLPYYEFLRPETDLYLLAAVAAAMSLLIITFMTGKSAAKRRHYLRFAPPAFGIALLCLNYYYPIFQGIPGTASSLLVFAAAYALLLVPMWFGAGGLFAPGQKHTAMLYALLFAPLTMMAFALLRGLDPTSHMIVYRTFDFLDLGLATMFAGGVLFLALKAKRIAPVILTTLLLILATTTPLAFQTTSLFGVHNQTYSYEADAFEIMSSLSPDQTIGSDQRISTSAHALFNFSGGGDLAYKIETGGSLSEYRWLVLESSWTTVGAQEFPLGQRVLDEGTFSDFLQNNDVIMLAGPSGEQLIVAVSAER